jgi:hypothetical protein
MFIRSDRLFLRPVWPEDRADLPGLADCAALTGSTTGGPTRHPRCVVTLPGAHGADVIGVAALVPLQAETELVVWIADHARQRGLGLEAAHAMLTLARPLGHGRLIAHRFADSPASARMLARLGFVATGQKRICRSRVRGVDLMAEVHAIDLAPPILTCAA